MAKYKIVHYINQFFAGIGGEEKADYTPELRAVSFTHLTLPTSELVVISGVAPIFKKKKKYKKRDRTVR